jgi:uncharacterized protein YjbI with pentapeptide repeats
VLNTTDKSEDRPVRADVLPPDAGESTTPRSEPERTATVEAGRDIEAILRNGGTSSLGPEELRGVKLCGSDLSGVDLSGADLSGADLSRANLSGADVSWANLSGAVLHQSKLDECDFLGADLSGADVSECCAKRCGFGGAVLTDANLFHTNLEGATLSHARLLRADVRSANLTGARAQESDFSEADFTQAILHGADLSQSNVHQALFRDADLRDAKVKDVRNYDKCDWIGVDIRNVNFTGAYMVRRQIIDENFLHEFRNRGRSACAIYFIWRITSDCGRSFVRWAGFVVLAAMLFSVGYSFVEIDYGPHESFLSPLYFSFVTLTTLGYGDVIPASPQGQILAMFQVLIGYIGLGGLLSIFANKMARRGG